MKSLEGKKIILTQLKDSAAKLHASLKASGAIVYSLPMIAISYSNTDTLIMNAIKNISSFNLIIFTSKHGVDAFFHHLKLATGTYSVNAEIEFAVIGESTAKKLKEFGYKATFLNTGTTSEDFLEYLLKEKILNSKNILLPLGNLAPDFLLTEFNKIASAVRINVYETHAPEVVDAEIVSMIKQNAADMVIFSSPSAFYNFNKYFSPDTGFQIPVFSTGQTTTSAIEETGFKVARTSAHSGVNSIRDEIINFFSDKKNTVICNFP